MTPTTEAVPTPYGGGVSRTRQTGPMGFDATRTHRKRTSDYVLVAAALLVVAALVAWAFLG